MSDSKSPSASAAAVALPAEVARIRWAGTGRGKSSPPSTAPIPQDLAHVATFAAQYGLAVVEQSAARRSVILSGTAAQFSQAFNVELRRYEHAHGTYRGRTGPVHVPAEYAE